MIAQISKEDIRKAAINVGYAMATWDASPMQPHVFSEKHQDDMRTILSMEHKRNRCRPVLNGLIACVLAIIIIFAGVYTFIPSVHAAVGEWFTKVWNNTIMYYFPHSGSDHAFPVMTPSGIPERFELVSDKRGDGWHTLKYADNSNGDHITFDYRWISRKQAERLEPAISKGESVQLYNGYNALLKESKEKTTLSWYEPQNLLGFTVESNLSAEELIHAFMTMDGHLPEYEPTWLPEGYELVDEYRDFGATIMAYMDPYGNTLMLSEYDYGDISEFSSYLTDADIVEEISINGCKASIGYTDATDDYTSSNIYNGLTLIWVDNDNKLIFVIDGSIDKETAISFAESLKAK